MSHRLLQPPPAAAPAIHALGLAAQDGGRNAKAVELFRRAIQLQPSIPDYHNDLGNALADLRRFDEALAAYRQAIHLRPDYPEAHANLGHVPAVGNERAFVSSSRRRAFVSSPGPGSPRLEAAKEPRRRIPTDHRRSGPSTDH